LRIQDAPEEKGMVRWDSGKEGERMRARKAEAGCGLEGDSVVTGDSVSSCDGTVGVMILVNYAKYEY